MQDINSIPETGSEPVITPAEPLARQSSTDRKWPVAIIASCLIHAAAAAAFLIVLDGSLDTRDAIQAEGTDQSGADVVGSDLDSQAPGTVNVTLVTDPRPAKPEAIEPVPPTEAPQPASKPPTPEAALEAVKQANTAPDILAAASPRSDDQSVAAPSEPTASANQAQSAEAPPTEAAQPPAPSEKPAAPAESAGSSDATNTRGAADGDEREAPVIASKGAKQTATGNAVESRYSGEIQKKLARANRRVSKSVQAKARNNARVVFVVMADGSIGDLQLAESSGSDELDQFALKMVRQQAPFPPIPPETGRSSWVFRARVGPF
jgi:protein TonB